MENLFKEVYNTVQETENEDENIERLEKAMEYFCGTWDKCEGYKHAILLTLDDQWQNHREDLTEEELQKLLDILTK